MRLTRPGRAAPALLLGIMALAGTVSAADQEYVIWRSTTLDRLDWTPGGTYRSREACDEAVAVRRGRVARTVTFLRRLGADDTLLRVVGDRIYECRPALTGPSTPPPTGESAQSP
jgi:hypothetical protein